MKRIQLLALSCFTTFALSASAADVLRGAAAVLDEVAAKTGAQAQAAAKPPSATATFRADLSNFTARVTTLAPAAAAQEWLALADRHAKLPSRVGFDANEEQVPPPQFTELIAALPPPVAWDELIKAIAARPAPTALKDAREIGLRLIGSALAGDRAAMTAQVTAFDDLLLKAKREEAMSLVHVSRSLNEALVAFTDDRKGILAGVERQLAAAERERSYGGASIYLPDLVGIVGEATATPLLERALKSKARDLTVQGKATSALARKLALKLIDDLKVPRWDLVNSLDAVELYEAFDKKFSQAKPATAVNPAEAVAELGDDNFGSDYQKQKARTYYLMGLIVRGRSADAAKFARSLKDQDATHEFQIASGEAALAKAGFMKELDDFLHELLSQDPELPFWESYVSAAASAGTTPRMLTLARAAAAKPELTGTKKGNLRENLYRALLAADQVEEGVKELRALLATAPKAGEQNRLAGRNRMTSQPIDFPSHSLALARLGQLLERPEWMEEGLAGAMPKADAAGDGDDYGSLYRLSGLIEVLTRAGRLGDAEKLIAEQLVLSVKRASAQRGYGGMGRSPGTDPLKLLANFYHHAGRHADVLLLLEKSPHWGAKDLVQFISTDNSGMDFDIGDIRSGRFSKGSKGSPLGQAAAAALLNAGRKDEARAIVDAMLDLSGGNDRAYELLIQLSGQDSVAKLDALFARDQFEERPLVWKALLLHQAAKHEEAEKIARQAIAIDPSDGEQGKNDRMRVYSVLADIRAARGDLKEAEFLRGAVRAIRLSERADDFYAAGLLSRAVKMYQDSLTHFTDAYCIQSRLAVHLTEFGQHELAAKHYEKAFELMPDSFGRVESHCFGCEGTFGAPQAQTVAERVFTSLVAKNPNKPQVHYLFGYLRQQQGRSQDSIPHYRQALKLDPDYLNAWEHLEQVSQEHQLPVAERDTIAFNILRLDPLGRHATASLNTVGDLRKLWSAVEAAAKFQVKPPVALLALPASREEVEKAEREAKKQHAPYGRDYGQHGFSRNRPQTPGAVLAQHGLFAGISELAGAASLFGAGE